MSRNSINQEPLLKTCKDQKNSMTRLCPTQGRKAQNTGSDVVEVLIYSKCGHKETSINARDDEMGESA